MGNWTHDSGAGADDFAVFFLSSGETIVYQGTDPANWSLLGVFRFGSPISRRAIVKLGGDLVAVTVDGYVSLMGAITQGRVSDRGILSDQINPAVTDVVRQAGSNFGWQAFFYPRGNMMMFNIPLTTNSTYNQHVFNTNTGAPCRFKGINSRCWGLYNDKAYFGGEGVVYLFDDGYDDNGTNIEADALTAVTYLGDRTRNKHCVMLQPITASDGVVAISTAVGADFKNPTVAYESPVFVGGDSDWDTATWGVDSWSSGDQITNDWVPVESFGYNFRTRVRVRSRGQNIKWYAINYMYNRGGVV
jgi:hypothetical protein